ncbi:AAA family ATPase [Sphingomonas sp. NIBR02145]|uniref:AAA family ATPase n=1 Tax=Sphingomonas sp. NIBR02145 TaxID=3014784 RepID=UPI0022B2B01B|nr:AAA family ATPase [Sphingomonas sp. NIBR02145]WHU03677.1 AAA family ATPase [Sphingomonas sp. NIBR02145]
MRSMQGMGIFADRNARSAPLQFRRYNLIYGFNGSGKSTLSRIFTSLEAGAVAPELREGCSFEVTLDDGAYFGCPAKPSGLERRILVFNCDYIERNLQWATGRARAVFYIGADQAEAATRLEAVEKDAAKQVAAKTLAETVERAAEKAFATFKRERAKLTASRLHLGSRKYEAPAFSKDYEAWHNEGASALSEEELKAAEDIRRLDEPQPRIAKIDFDAATIDKAYQFIVEICGQSLTTVALEEAKRFPEMLLWLKHGQEFHAAHSLESCLFCGNALSAERRATLASAFDDQVDQFVSRIARTVERLQAMIGAVERAASELPTSDDLASDLRVEFKAKREAIVAAVRMVRGHLHTLEVVLSFKQERPAAPADLSQLATQAEVASAAMLLAEAIAATNEIFARHNDTADNFAKRKEAAEVAIRKHFVAECGVEFTTLAGEVETAATTLVNATAELERLSDEARGLRQQIRKHGPAAGVINKLIASYLGHGEITIEPAEEGYVLLRHGKPICGIPSEGEKTAIAIAYFLSSIEAEGRQLKDMIVVVDDPVSSLDTKALNYACTLVRSRLEGVSQLFILTHNLQALNEFRKSWKARARPPGDKEPTATFLFIDVAIPEGQARRSSTIVEMSRLLREYDSEYHFLFSHVLKFTADPNGYYDHGYMMPNVLRRVLDVFLAFKCPGMGLSEQVKKLCADYPALDQVKLVALERLAQVESHSDNLDDLLTFSSMTLEETRAAASALLEMMEEVDSHHLAGLRRLCR